MVLLTDDMIEKATRAMYDEKTGFTVSHERARAALEAVLPMLIEECARRAEGKFEGETLYIEGRNDAADAVRLLAMDPPSPAWAGQRGEGGE